MINKSVKLYLGNGYPVRIPVSQFDTGWTFTFTIYYNGIEWTIPAGSSVVMNGLKPDGNVFAFSGLVLSNKVVVEADVQMTAVAGDTICELSILADGKTVGTANFVLAVEAAPNSTGATPSASDLDAYGAIISGELDTYFEQHPEMIEGKGLSEPIRLAILDCFQHVAWGDEHGSDYYNALHELLMNKEVLSITAVFDPGQTVIYTDDTLDDLKQYLTVTANYDDGTSGVVTTYELSGTLTAGTSTITVTYDNKTTTFDVTVVAPLYSIPDFAAQTVLVDSYTCTVSKSDGYYTFKGRTASVIYISPLGVVSKNKSNTTWFSTIAGKSLESIVEDITWNNPTTGAVTLNTKFSRAETTGNLYSAEFGMAASSSGTNGEAKYELAAATYGRDLADLAFQFANNPHTSDDLTATFKVKVFVDGVRYL